MCALVMSSRYLTQHGIITGRHVTFAGVKEGLASLNLDLTFLMYSLIYQYILKIRIIKVSTMFMDAQGFMLFYVF